MPIKIYTLVPYKVILARPSGELTVADAQASDIEILRLMTEGYVLTSQKVHLIGDTTRLVRQINPFQFRQYHTYLSHPACGEVVVGGIGNPMLLFLAKIVGKMAKGVNISIYESVQEAIHALQKRDSTLPDLLEAFQRFEAAHHE